jgi:hypothetical protein
MKTSRQYIGFGQTLVALSVAAAFSPALAQDIAALSAAENFISIGVGAASGDEKDRARFGMFNGLRKHDTNGLLGFSYLNRDNASGTWMGLEARNLGLDSREAAYTYRRLGDLKFTAEYGELVRHDPRTQHHLRGGHHHAHRFAVGTPGAGQDLNLNSSARVSASP